jgi:hypothetical protein
MEIPQDIIDNVIAAVGDDTGVLKQCTLVSSSFLLPSRKQLFSGMTIESDETCQGIHQFLIQNPVIQSFVRDITLKVVNRYHNKISDWINGTSLLAILRLPFSRLECFSVRGNWDGFTWNWNSFSSELKDALSNIIHSSTLKTLSLKDSTNVPITYFFHLHLTTLELDFSPIDFCDENSNSLIWVASEGVTPMIDRCVWYLMEEGSDHGTRLPSSAISH